MSDDHDGGHGPDRARKASAELRIAFWRWWLRLFDLEAIAMTFGMEWAKDLSPAVFLMIGFVLGTLFDRFVLQSAAIWLVSRSDGRSRTE